MKRLLALLLLFAAPVFSNTWKVAVNGSSLGNGTDSAPWDLTTVFANPPAVIKPGDEICLHGGTYKNQGDEIVSHLVGTNTAPIIVRSCPGEWAVLDGAGGEYALDSQGQYVWYMDLEIMDSATSKTATGPGAGANPIAWGFADYNQGNCLINSYVHDTAEGISAYNASANACYVGNVIMYNGWIGTDRNHGHGVYLQNIQGTKVVQDNIIGDNADEGMQVYGSGAASVVGFTVTGNIVYDNSSWPYPHYQYGLLLAGGSGKNHGNTFSSNLSYFDLLQMYGFNQFGQYGAGYDNNATGNTFIGGLTTVAIAGENSPFTFLNNVLVNLTDPSLELLRVSQFHDSVFGQQVTSGYTFDYNTYYNTNAFWGDGTYIDTNGGFSDCCSTLQNFTQWQTGTGFDAHSTFIPNLPTTNWVKVTPNSFGTKRANVYIVNWEKLASVPVDVSAILSVGDPYVVVDAQCFRCTPVLSGTYQGGTLSIPMTGLAKTQFFGNIKTPSHTSTQTPGLGTFIVMSANSAPIPQPAGPPPIGPPPPPPPVTTFKVGDSVEVLPSLTTPLHIRNAPDPSIPCPGPNCVGSENAGNIGTVSKDANGNFTATSGGDTFYYVQWSDGTIGWSVSSYMELSGSPAPQPTKPAAPTNLMISGVN